MKTKIVSITLSYEHGTYFLTKLLSCKQLMMYWAWMQFMCVFYADDTVVYMRDFHWFYSVWGSELGLSMMTLRIWHQVFRVITQTCLVPYLQNASYCIMYSLILWCINILTFVCCCWSEVQPSCFLPRKAEREVWRQGVEIMAGLSQIIFFIKTFEKFLSENESFFYF